MKRKIIQVVPCENRDSTLVLTALCDDGTVWEYYSKRIDKLSKMVWEKITDGPE